MIYRNARTGREVVRQDPDPWLDASSGWEAVAPSDQEPSSDGDEQEEV